MAHHYLIRRTEPDVDGSTLWWSNEGGWWDLSAAIVFTPEERAVTYLPTDGEWVAFRAQA